MLGGPSAKCAISQFSMCSKHNILSLLLTVAVYCGFLNGKVPTLKTRPSISTILGDKDELSDVLQSVDVEEFDFSELSSTFFFLFLQNFHLKIKFDFFFSIGYKIQK